MFNTTRRFSRIEEKNICNDYKILKSCHLVSKKYDTYPATIHRILKRNNIVLDNNIRTKYSLNESYFENIDSESKAYWLGFIAADGWVISSKRIKQFGLEIQLEDLAHLEKFNKEIGYSKEVVQKKNGFKGIASCIVSRKKFVEHLLSKGIVQNKSILLQWPTIDENELMRHFLRGYFDGDGCWSIYRGRVMFEVIGTDSFTKIYQKLLIKNLNLNKTKRPNTGKNGIAKVVRYCGNGNCKKIYDYLYQDATLFLERKKEKVSSILENYNGENSKNPRKVIQMELDGSIVSTYDSISSAATQTRTDASKISMVCKGTRNKAGGFKWKYAN